MDLDHVTPVSVRYFLINIFESVTISAPGGRGAVCNGHTSLGDYFTAQKQCGSLKEAPK